MNIGEKIRHFRTLNNLTQKVLGEKSGIDEATIRKYELGTRNPKPAQLKKIAQALGVGESVLMGISSGGHSLRTVGDLMGIIFELCDSKMLVVDGKRSPDGFLMPESVKLRINPILNVFFSVLHDEDRESFPIN